MPNKHFCQGPTCHEKPTTDRFLKSRGVIRGKYAYLPLITPLDFKNLSCVTLVWQYGPWQKCLFGIISLRHLKPS